MVTRTKCGWMALGGLLVLFGIVLTCKLRDGSRILAQSEPADSVLSDLKADDLKTTAEPPLASADAAPLALPVGKPLVPPTVDTKESSSLPRRR